LPGADRRAAEVTIHFPIHQEVAFIARAVDHGDAPPAREIERPGEGRLPGPPTQEEDAGAAEQPVVGPVHWAFPPLPGRPQRHSEEQHTACHQAAPTPAGHNAASYVDSCAIAAPSVLSGWGRSAIDVTIRSTVARRCHSAW
jgi:hypothetical protein